MLEEKLSLPGLAFENTAYRLDGKKVDFLDLEVPPSKNPVKRLIGSLIKKSGTGR